MLTAQEKKLVAALKEKGYRISKPTTRTPKTGDNKNGVILYEGPSMIDGESIVVIATALKNTTSNDKTGDEIQTWILRADIHPSEALKTGGDASICGDCKHRPASTEVPKGKSLPKRSCYVRMDAPTSVWRCYRRGGYLHIDHYPKAWDLMAGRMRRCGSYGDPAAAPLDVWRRFIGDNKSTGYTHQWQTYPEFVRYLMASVDTEDEYAEARELGWRTFRIKQADQPRLRGEFACPASEEEGKRLTCDTCGACNGNPNERSNAASPVINVHGTGKKHFKLRLQVLN